MVWSAPVLVNTSLTACSVKHAQDRLFAEPGPNKNLPVSEQPGS